MFCSKLNLSDQKGKGEIEKQIYKMLIRIQHAGVNVKEETELEDILNKYVAKMIQHKGDVAIIEAVDEQEKIKRLLQDLDQFGIKELVRTGRVAMGY